MARDDPHFRLRVPAELKAWIERSAADNNRSMNAEIVARLEDSFEESLNLSEEARAIIIALLKRIKYGSNEVSGMFAEGQAMSYLANMPQQSIDEMGEWFAMWSNEQRKLRDYVTPSEMKEIEDRYMALARKEAKKVAKFMRRLGWEVIPPAEDESPDE